MKKRILRCVGGGLLLLAPVLLWSWQPYGLRTPVNALWWQLLMGALLASGLLVLRVIDLAALGSFAEALLALLAGVVLLLFGRVWTGTGFAVPDWHDPRWLPAVLTASLAGCCMIVLCAARCVQCAAARRFGGFSLPRFSVLLAAVLILSLYTLLQQIFQGMGRTLAKHTELAGWNRRLWFWAALALPYLTSFALLPFARRERAGGVTALALGAVLLALHIACFRFNLRITLQGILAFVNGPLYLALLLLGLTALHRRPA